MNAKAAAVARELVRRHLGADKVIWLPAGVAGDDTSGHIDDVGRFVGPGRVVLARSVVVDEITAAYERLHVTASMDILHGATDQFRFVVPAGFEITGVATPELSHWEVAQDDD